MTKTALSAHMFMKAFGIKPRLEDTYDYQKAMLRKKKLKGNAEYITVDISNSSTTGNFNWYTSINR